MRYEVYVAQRVGGETLFAIRDRQTGKSLITGGGKPYLTTNREAAIELARQWNLRGVAS